MWPPWFPMPSRRLSRDNITYNPSYDSHMAMQHTFMPDANPTSFLWGSSLHATLLSTPCLLAKKATPHLR
jgi:hypothetical protein